MENLEYEVEIEAPIEKVWELLWNSETYNAWTKFFAPDSSMCTDWQIGGKTYFLDGEGNGMVSTIEELKKPEILIFNIIYFLYANHLIFIFSNHDHLHIPTFPLVYLVFILN
jgi:uncharacterized protein YndB with AHSA1/START domain